MDQELNLRRVDLSIAFTVGSHHAVPVDFGFEEDLLEVSWYAFRLSHIHGGRACPDGGN